MNISKSNMATKLWLYTRALIPNRKFINGKEMKNETLVILKKKPHLRTPSSF